MMVTHARQHQQEALKEEEHLRQEQDGPVIIMFDSVDYGVQAEGTEDHETEEGQAEVLRHLERTRSRSNVLRGPR